MKGLLCTVLEVPAVVFVDHLIVLVCTYLIHSALGNRPIPGDSRNLHDSFAGNDPRKGRQLLASMIQSATLCLILETAQMVG